MKAVIIAAGKGSRLKHYTSSLPKCMLLYKGKTILDSQLESFYQNNIQDISIVKGWMQEKIIYPELKSYVNSDYENNNILASLFYAEKELCGDIIVSYSDIVFSKSVVSGLIESKTDITIVTDTEWRRSYIGRTEHPHSEAEKVISDSEGNVMSIGKNLDHEGKSIEEFIGMVKFSTKGVSLFKEFYHDAKNKYSKKAFQQAPVFERAYLTDLFQEMIDSGVSIATHKIQGGWMEIDTIEDYKNLLGGSLL